jgi:hypothetical protein
MPSFRKISKLVVVVAILNFREITEVIHYLASGTTRNLPEGSINLVPGGNLQLYPVPSRFLTCGGISFC